jgi:hypothetical protein
LLFTTPMTAPKIVRSLLLLLSWLERRWEHGFDETSPMTREIRHEIRQFRTPTLASGYGSWNTQIRSRGRSYEAPGLSVHPLRARPAAAPRWSPPSFRVIVPHF